MKGTAIISDDGRYRYGLVRRWSEDESAFATFIMLNPSTADASTDDPTIRRCIGFARAWGMGALHVVNLYAFRATNPKELWTVEDPVGPDADTYLLAHSAAAIQTRWPLVAAWGSNARPDRIERVLGLLGMNRLECLGVTKSGAPRHPLYLAADTQLERWPPRVLTPTPVMPIYGEDA